MSELNEWTSYFTPLGVDGGGVEKRIGKELAVYSSDMIAIFEAAIRFYGLDKMVPIKDKRNYTLRRKQIDYGVAGAFDSRDPALEQQLRSHSSLVLSLAYEMVRFKTPGKEIIQLAYTRLERKFVILQVFRVTQRHFGISSVPVAEEFRVTKKDGVFEIHNLHMPAYWEKKDFDSEN
jgi:hypothetical protein